MLKDPPKIPFKTSIKITSRGSFFNIEFLFFLPFEAISRKSPQKMLREGGGGGGVGNL